MVAREGEWSAGGTPLAIYQPIGSERLWLRVLEDDLQQLDGELSYHGVEVYWIDASSRQRMGYARVVRDGAA